MGKIARLVLTVLFLELLVGGVQAQAATQKLRISQVSVVGLNATIKWDPIKLSSKDFVEVEFTKTPNLKPFRTIKTKSTGIVAKLDPFSKYTVRIRKSLTPKAWTTVRTFTTSSEAVSGLAVNNVTYTAAELSWNSVPGATAYDVVVNDQTAVSVITTKYSLTTLTPGSKYSVLIKPKAGLVFGTSSAPVGLVTLNAGPAKFASSSTTTSGTTLTWEPIEGAESYNLYANKKLLINTKTTNHTVTGLLPGTSMSYTVAAVVAKVETLISESVEITTLVDTPASPVLQNITSNSVTAKWTVDRNATSYEVVLYDANGKTAISTNTVDGSLSSTTFAGLSTQTNYAVGIKITYGTTSSKQSALSTFTTTKPSITNVVLSNVTTTSATLNWYSMPGVVTYEVYRDGVMIPAATSALTVASVSYNFASLAPGNTYKFSVRATYLDGMKTTQYTDFVDITQTLLIDPTYAPTSITSLPPVITLPYATVPIVGATISASTGSWTSVPAVSGYAYQWQRSLDGGTTWANLSGETKSTYKVVASDYAFRLRVRVTATNLNGSTIANSATSSAVVETYNIQIPVVRGTLVSGQLLEVTDGSWSSDYPLTLQYQWNKNGSAISGEISPSYTLVDGDIGANITVTVTANSSLGSVSANSTLRSAVAAAGNTVAPVVTGTVKPYNTLTTSDGTWLKSPTITYQWQRSLDGTLWNNIASATNATYVVAVGDVGYFLRSQVFGSRTVSSTAYKYTAPSLTTVVVPALTAVSSSAPVVSGSWTTGSTLTTTNGVWTSSGTFTYQWQRSTDNSTWSSITGATSSSYVLTSADATPPAYVRVQVYLTGSSGADGVAYSVATAKVGAPYNTAAPAISGSQRVGVALTSSDGTWTGSPTFAYQWQTSSDGIAWANIDGATSSTYTPTYTIANLRLRVSVSGVNATDTATVTSQVVQGFLAPIASAIPSISGTVQSGSTLTTTSGTWPSTSSGYVYSWHRSSDGGVTWTDIAGQTSTTYALVAADVGYRIRSQVTISTNAGSSTAYSLPTVAVAPAP